MIAGGSVAHRATSVPLGDGVDQNDKPFLSSFPYVALPHDGFDSRSSGPSRGTHRCRSRRLRSCRSEQAGRAGLRRRPAAGRLPQMTHDRHPTKSPQAPGARWPPSPRARPASRGQPPERRRPARAAGAVPPTSAGRLHRPARRDPPARGARRTGRRRGLRRARRRLPRRRRARAATRASTRAPTAASAPRCGATPATSAPCSARARWPACATTSAEQLRLRPEARATPAPGSARLPGDRRRPDRARPLRRRRSGRSSACSTASPNLASYSRASYFRELHGRPRRRRDGDAAGGVRRRRRARERGLRAGAAGRPRAAARAHRPRRGAAYTSALRSLPGYPAGMVGLARVDAAGGDLGRAAARLRRAAERLPLTGTLVLLAAGRAGARPPGRGRAARSPRRAPSSRLLRAAATAPDAEAVLFEADHGDPPAGGGARPASVWRRRRASARPTRSAGR